MLPPHTHTHTFAHRLPRGQSGYNLDFRISYRVLPRDSAIVRYGGGDSANTNLDANEGNFMNVIFVLATCTLAAIQATHTHTHTYTNPYTHMLHCLRPTFECTSYPAIQLVSFIQNKHSTLLLSGLTNDHRHWTKKIPLKSIL